MLPYLHPLAGGVTLALLAYVGSLGLRSRSDRRRADELLDRHARLGPLVYGLVAASWLGGVASVYWLRPEMELADSAHFRIGSWLAVALSGSLLTSRWMSREAARALHPWLGAAAVLLGLAQVFFGLQITP